jgi:hypothetical protein
VTDLSHNAFIEAESETRAAGSSVFRFECTTLSHNDHTGQRQPHPEAVAVGSFSFVKAFKNMG